MKYSHKHCRPGGADHRSLPGSASTCTSTKSSQNPIFQQPVSNHQFTIDQFIHYLHG